MAIPAYLWLLDETDQPVKGSVNIHNREGSIEILEFMHSVDLPVNRLTSKITSKRIHSDIALLKEIDIASPYLYRAVTTGRKFNKAELKFYKININGHEEEYFRITVENAIINEMTSLMMDDKDPLFGKHNHLEAFYISYEKITWHYIDGNIIHSDNRNKKMEAA
ncbi:type VI secretion system tube protein Hcp [Cronobacter muytjensii]|nr:type VI secretion system tube protein Hcp [Cronobacter muytjensii]ELY6226525.1 type VI secretion system tube protein Hcp [Cronobacter muytjensii]